MNRKLKENARKLCEQIKNLTNELDIILKASKKLIFYLKM